MPISVSDIEPYLADVGLRTHRNINQFWSHLDSRYPKTQVSDLERAYLKLERGDESGFYLEIFQNLKVSIDFSSLRFDLYRNFLKWFIATTNDLKPQSIVDVGCGNGILTCFYAKLFPEANVLGFDISESGVECSTELAKQLGIKNARFVAGDVNDLTLPIEKGSVDLMVSVATLGPPAQGQGSEVPAYELLTKKPRLADMIQLSNLAPYLAPDHGLFISFEKVSNLASQALWANIIQKCGLGIDLDKTWWLSYQNIESDSINLPVIVAGPHIMPSHTHDLMAFLAIKENDLDEWTLDFGKEALTEIAFTFINPKTYLRGARATYTDGSGTYWYELWQAGPFLIVFEHTDQGFRTMRVAPATNRVQLLQSVDDWIEQTSSYADVHELSEPEINFGSSALEEKVKP